MLINDPSDSANPTRLDAAGLLELSDAALIDKIATLTGIARESTAELIAHLVELERRNLHLACGFSSIFFYCRDVLRFSEPESYQRMQAAHVAARFPVILPLLADGRLHLAGVRLLAPHLEDEDHLALIGGALGKSKRKIEALLARWFPKPDVPTSIRKVPAPRAAQPSVAPAGSPATAPAVADTSASQEAPTTPLIEGKVSGELGATSTGGPAGERPEQPTAPVGAEAGTSARASAKPPVHIVPLSEASYYVKLTAPEAMIGRLRLAQELLSHAIPDGDIVEVIDRALMLIIKEEQRRRHAATHRPRKPSPPADPATREITAHVQRVVTERDGGQCAFVARDGRRCESRRFLEYHHLKPWAAGGPPSVENIALRCRAHNKYEATVYFDPIRKERAARAEAP